MPRIDTLRAGDQVHGPLRATQEHSSKVSSGIQTAGLQDSASVFQGPTLQMFCGACSIPHVDRTDTGGEDAHFISHASLGAVGVADGVGSWSEDGVDPALYSRGLMANCCQALDDNPGTIGAVQVLEYAQENTRVEGSSTACVAVLRPGGVLEVANVGDSGLRVIRNGVFAFQTEAQEHGFNQPYQLAHPDLVTCTDAASEAQHHLVPLKAGDVVVLGTDGLFNNMWDDQLLKLVAHKVKQAGHSSPAEEAEHLAHLLAEAAHKNAQKRFFRSPFGVEAASRGMGPLLFRLFPFGGKMDDTTVVVCVVRGEEGQQQ